MPAWWVKLHAGQNSDRSDHPSPGPLPVAGSGRRAGPGEYAMAEKDIWRARMSSAGTFPAIRSFRESFNWRRWRRPGRWPCCRRRRPRARSSSSPGGRRQLPAAGVPGEAAIGDAVDGRVGAVGGARGRPIVGAELVCSGILTFALVEPITYAQSHPFPLGETCHRHRTRHLRPREGHHQRRSGADLDTSDEWIRQRTGIGERQVADPGLSPLPIWGFPRPGRRSPTPELDPEDIDLVITATISPDQIMPATAARVAYEAAVSSGGLRSLGRLCGFLYSLALAASAVAAGLHDHVLVVGAEVISRISIGTDRSTAVVFGDGPARQSSSGGGGGRPVESGGATGILGLSWGATGPAADFSLRTGRGDAHAGDDARRSTAGSISCT